VAACYTSFQGHILMHPWYVLVKSASQLVTKQPRAQHSPAISVLVRIELPTCQNGAACLSWRLELSHALDHLDQEQDLAAFQGCR